MDSENDLPVSGEDEVPVEAIPADSLSDIEEADGGLSVRRASREDPLLQGPTTPPRGRWGRAPEPPPPAKPGTLLSWGEINKYVDPPASSEPLIRPRGAVRRGLTSRAAWIFLYGVGLGAMAATFPVASALHGQSLAPLLLFPAGGGLAVMGVMLALLEGPRRGHS